MNRSCLRSTLLWSIRSAACAPARSARYVTELEARVRRALGTADQMLVRAAQLDATGEDVRRALGELGEGITKTRRLPRRGSPVQEVTWEFQRRAATVSNTQPGRP